MQRNLQKVTKVHQQHRLHPREVKRRRKRRSDASKNGLRVRRRSIELKSSSEQTECKK